MRTYLGLLVAASLGCLLTATTVSAQSVTGTAMRTLFSPMAAPAEKTMGLFQRNFLEMANRPGELEVALVIDGTDSMADQLAGVRQSIGQMMADLRRLRGGAVRVALVVYRDAGSPSGEVTVPLATFSDDRELIQSAVDQIEPQSGAPYFYELMDVGLHRAITDLPWSQSPTVSRWILLFGDAPPYQINHLDESMPAARRRFADDLLVAQATQRGISIHCVLCTSTEATRASFDQSIDQTREVMDRLSSQTGGMVLDLSYRAIREALVSAGPPPEVPFTPIEPITDADVAAGRSRTVDQPLRLAILPHCPIDDLRFDPQLVSTRVATAISEKFRYLPGVQLVGPLQIERAVGRMRAEGLDGRDVIRGLSARVRADYVIWGLLREDPALTTVAFRNRDGAAVVRVNFDGQPDRLAQVFLTSASQNAGDQPLADLATEVLRSADGSFLQQPIADDALTTGQLLAAIGSLQRAIGVTVGENESATELAAATAAIDAVLRREPANPLANWVAANIAFNQAAAEQLGGRGAAADDLIDRCRSSLRLAARRAADLASEPLATEIRADNALIVRGDVPAAMTLYESMTDPAMPMDTQKRGHWMLAGLRAGDWGAPAEVVDPAESRRHVIAILARWPDDPEAELLRRWLRWDQQRGTTTYNHLPQLSDVWAVANGG